MKHTNKQSGLLRGAGLVVVVALAVLLLLTVTVWAAWGTGAYARVLNLGNWGSTLQASLTATPTKTPRPVTPEPTQVPVELKIITPEPATATPAPTATREREADTTPDPMPARLAEVVRQFGIDPSRRFIIVDTATQQMSVWDPGKPVREIPVSTGDESRGYRTPAWYGLVGRYVGTFNAHGVYADEGWYLFEDAGSILIHGAPYKIVDGAKVYEDMEALGSYPASRGCIRLRPEDALWLTGWDPQGVPLVILPRNTG